VGTPWLKALLEVALWLGNTVMGTAAVLGISEIKPFRQYLEKRIERAFSEIGPSALGKPLQDLVQSDFFERATSETYLKKFTDLRPIRAAVVRASIPALDQDRESILNEHLYPLFEKPWRENFYMNFSVAEDHDKHDKFLVTHDHRWKYMNSAQKTLTLGQKLRLVLPLMEDGIVEETLNDCRFECGGDEVRVPWKVAKNQDQIVIEAKFSVEVPPGGIMCRDRRKYYKPRSENFYLQFFSVLTRNVDVSFTHPAYIQPRARAFFLQESTSESVLPNLHRWTFSGWFLEREGVIVFWPSI
jgi:hypothetical protein